MERWVEYAVLEMWWTEVSAMKYNDRGEELPDDTPMEAPVKFRRPPSIQELIAMHVKAAMQVERKMGKDDDDDYDEDDESDDVLTPYEIDAYAGEANAEIRKAEETQKVLDKLVKKRDNKSTVNGDRGDKDGFDEDSKRVGGDVSTGKADMRAKGAGPEAAGGSPEKDSGAS